jgi:hypothetical protein
MRAAAPFLVAILLAGCTTLPDVPLPRQGLDSDADYPDFVPINRISLDPVEAAENLGEPEEETEDALARRVALLRARAERLRTASLE